MIYSSNTWGIALAAIAAFVVGWLWYGPIFGRMWAGLMGFDMSKPMDAKMKSEMVRSMVLNLVATLITAFAFFTIAENLLLDSSTVYCFAILAWLGFMMPLTLGGVLWERKSWKLFFLNSAYQIVNLLVVACIYAWFV